MTDTHALLHKESFHPRHTFRGIVKSQLLRFHRICTREEDFEQAVRILFKALQGRGYGRSFLKRCLRSFRDDKCKERGDLIPLVTTYSAFNSSLFRTLNHNFDSVLGQTDLLPTSTVISAYKRNRNLEDILISAKLPSLI